MAKQECITLFPEVESVTKKMSDEQFGVLIRAVIAYRLRGEVYSGEDIAVDIAFQFLANQQDRTEAIKAARSRSASSRWDTQPDANNNQSCFDECKVMQSDLHACKVVQTDANDMQTDANGMQSDAPIQSYPIQSNPIQSIESKADKPPAPAKTARKSYGSFGWVKLTDDEYMRLLNDLGEAEVKRCIAYVDESAQANGNKNKWRDWNLVVRKCHRYGWGISPSRYGKPEIPKGASGKLGQAELEAIQRVLREG